MTLFGNLQKSTQEQLKEAMSSREPLVDLLRGHDDALMKWRYLHEEEGGLDLEIYPMIRALRGVIEIFDLDTTVWEVERKRLREFGSEGRDPRSARGLC